MLTWAQETEVPVWLVLVVLAALAVGWLIGWLVTSFLERQRRAHRKAGRELWAARSKLGWGVLEGHQIPPPPPRPSSPDDLPPAKGDTA